MFQGEKMRPSSNAPAKVSRKASSQGAWISRNDSTPTAIDAEINATLSRDRGDSATTTKKKPTAAPGGAPPYFTTKAGSPRPKPNPRKDRPDITIKRQRPARTINTGPRRGSRVRRFEE